MATLPAGLEPKAAQGQFAEAAIQAREDLRALTFPKGKLQSGGWPLIWQGTLGFLDDVLAIGTIPADVPAGDPLLQIAEWLQERRDNINGDPEKRIIGVYGAVFNGLQERARLAGFPVPEKAQVGRPKREPKAKAARQDTPIAPRPIKHVPQPERFRNATVTWTCGTCGHRNADVPQGNPCGNAACPDRQRKAALLVSLESTRQASDLATAQYQAAIANGAREDELDALLANCRRADAAAARAMQALPLPPHIVAAIAAEKGEAPPLVSGVDHHLRSETGIEPAEAPPALGGAEVRAEPEVDAPRPPPTPPPSEPASPAAPRTRPVPKPGKSKHRKHGEAAPREAAAVG